jgi:hypothetical protein
MASKADLEKENKELREQISKMEETQFRGDIQKLEDNNVRFSKGDNIFTAKINQNGNLTIQVDGYINVTPISCNTIALFETIKPMY